MPRCIINNLDVGVTLYNHRLIEQILPYTAIRGHLGGGTHLLQEYHNFVYLFRLCRHVHCLYHILSTQNIFIKKAEWTWLFQSVFLLPIIQKSLIFVYMQLFKIVFKIFHLRGPSASKFYIQPEIHFSNFFAASYIYLQCPYNCKLVIIL